MPIEVKTQIRVLDQEEFHALDRKLMGIVFQVHNEFGRFLDEALYKREIIARWKEAGFGAVEEEARIVVRHQSFQKEFRMDLLFDHGLMLEAKVADAIVSVHRAQSLNYLLLAGLKHGRLANFRPARVEHEFISTKLTHDLRRRIVIDDARWREVNDESRWLRSKVVELLADWGAFLEVNLYREAITHLLGGEKAVVQPVAIYSGRLLVGEQPIHLLNRHTAFAFSAVTRKHDTFREHQIRFLEHTRLKFVQWVNLNHHRLELETLTKS